MPAIQVLLLLTLGVLVVILLLKLLPMHRQLEELRNQINANSAMHLSGGIQAIQHEQARVAYAVGQSAQTVAGQLGNGMQTVSAQLASGVQALQQEQVRVAETLGQVTQGVSALKQFQDEVRTQLMGMGRWAQSFSEIHGESRAILQRMQLLLAGTPHRGAAGESILREILSMLPAGLREENVRINNLVVEFAVKLPGDKFLPIDSKWPAVAQLEALQAEQDVEKRSALLTEIDRAVGRKAQEVAKYLCPDRTLMLGVAAVPDPIFAACTGAHVRAFQQGIIILPYSLAVPYVLSLLVLLWRFGQALDTSRLQAAIAQLDRTLQATDAELDGRFSRALTMLQNTQSDIRLAQRDARDAVASLRISSEPFKSISQVPAPLPEVTA